MMYLVNRTAPSEEDTVTDTAMDKDEARARQLQEILQSRGIDCVTHWDRSPWGVRIWLTPEDGPEYATPSLFVLTELEATGFMENSYKWYGCFGGFDEDIDYALQGTTIHWDEAGLTDTTRLEHLAEDVTAFLKVLRSQVVTS